MAYLSVSFEYKVSRRPTESTSENQRIAPMPFKGSGVLQFDEHVPVEKGRKQCQKALEIAWRRIFPSCEIEITDFSVPPDKINADS